ncbi:MAG: AraC family transcriptional regulator [Planctomycetota bacterium]
MTTVRSIRAFTINVTAGTRCLEHRHPVTEIVVNFGASGVLHQDGKRRTYRDGDSFVYQPGSSHWIETTKSGEQVCLNVAGCGAEVIPPGVYTSASVVEAAKRVRAALSGSMIHQQERIDLLSGLLVLSLAETIKPPSGLAERAQHLLNEGLADGRGVSEAAHALRISPDRLRQVFRKAFGISPLNYLMQRRLDRARDLLASSGLPIQEIAETCGMPDAFYFARFFRRATGVTPTAWRQTHAS